MKTCFRCGEAKALASFYKHPRMADGHLNKCIECTKRDVKENYQVKAEQCAEYERTPARRASRNARRPQWRASRKARVPEKVAATAATTSAIRTGRLVRQPCERCGELKVQAHHDDYSKPLDVRWLCFRHHREHHGQTVRSKVA